MRHGDLLTEDQVNIAWAAGLFEGEGSIHLATEKRYNSKRIRLQINMTDLDVLQKFQRIVGGTISGPYQKSGFKVEGKPQYHWQESKQLSVNEILTAFWPFLCERRKSKALKIGFVI